jgi:hypothetical protein
MAQFAIDELFTTGVQISGFIFDRSYSLGIAGQVLTATSSGVMWQADSSNADLSSLSGQIAATGTLLNNRINSLSGYSDATFATITNLATTGSVLDTKINTLSGYSNANFATILNLAATGSVLDTKINTLSGYSNSTFATITNLAATGSTLNARINSLSGYAGSTFLSGQGVANWTARWNGTKELITGSIYDLGTGVGIGTTSPSAKLEVFSGNAIIRNDNPGGVASLYIRNWATNPATQLVFGNSTSDDSSTTLDLSANVFSITNYGDPGSYIKFGTRNLSTAEIRVTIDPSGRVGIGTEIPSTLLSIGGAGSTTALSGITFGADSQANLYRISSSRIKTDGNFTIDGQGGGASSLVLNRISDSYENGMTFNTAGVTDWYFYVDNGNNNLQIQRSSELDPRPRVRFDGANSNILFNLGGGNVGIGTDTPAGRLHVSGADGNVLFLKQGVTGSQGGIYFENADGFATSSARLYFISGDSVLFTRGPSNLAWSVSQNANVGIGVSNPSEKLTITGAVKILTRDGANFKVGDGSNNNTFLEIDYPDISSANAYFRLFRNTNTNGGKYFQILKGDGTAGSQTLLNANGDSHINAVAGNLGIGTDSPTQKLQVSGTVKIQSLGVYSDPTDNAAFLNYDTNGGIFTLSARSDAGNTYMAFRTSNGGTGSEKVRITNNGNVIIGNTTAYAGLTISDVAANDGNDSLAFFYRGTAGAHESLIRFYDFRGQNNASIGNHLQDDGVGTQKADLVFKTARNSSPIERMRITNAGSLLIGDTTQTYGPTTLGYMFGVKSQVYQSFISIAKSGQTLDSGGIILGLDTTTAYLWARENIPISFGTNNNEKFRISADGNLGIGTASPTTLLSVGGAGSTAAASGLTFGGDAQANLYRSAEDTIKTDGSLEVTTNLNIGADLYVADELGVGVPIANKRVNYGAQIATANASIQLVLGRTANATGQGAIGADANNTFAVWNVSGGLSKQMVVSQQGNVGIATDNPVAKLHISDPSNNEPWMLLDINDTYFKRIVFSEERAAYGNTGYGGYIGYDADANTVSLGTYHASGHYRSLNIKREDGNIGIGTTNPVSKLNIFSETGTSQIFNQLQLTNLGTLNPGNIVGIGFAAGESTQYGVKGSIGFERTDNYGRGSLIFYTNNTAGTESVSTSNERLRIAANGNVGINTVSPNSTLRIDGSFSQRANGGVFQEYKNVTTFNLDNYGVGGYVIQTPFKLGVNYEMSIVHVKGYNYGNSSLYDFKVIFYDYGPSHAPINYSLIDLGNDGSPKYLAKDANNNLAICFGNSGDSSYFNRFTVDCITTRNGSSDYSQGWSAYQTTGLNYGFASTGVYQLNSPINFRTSNYVGIGTTNPQYKLDVKGDVFVQGNLRGDDGARGYLLGKDTLIGGRSYLVLDPDSTDGVGAGSDYLYIAQENTTGVISNSANGAIVFRGGSERVRIDTSNGNVGIGTFNPGYLLDLYKVPATSGTLQPMLTLNSDYASATTTNFGSSIVFKGRTAGNELQENAQIAAYNENANDNGYALGFYTRPSVAGGLQQRLTILRGGNVGVGTTNPQTKLDVRGTLSVYQSADSDYIYFDHAGVNTWRTRVTTDNTSTYVIGNDAPGVPLANKILNITNAGKVGIGIVSPATLLGIGGAGSTTAASGLTFGNDAQANLYRVAEDTIKTDGSLTVAGLIYNGNNAYYSSVAKSTTANWGQYTVLLGNNSYSNQLIQVTVDGGNVSWNGIFVANASNSYRPTDMWGNVKLLECSTYNCNTDDVILNVMSNTAPNGYGSVALVLKTNGLVNGSYGTGYANVITVTSTGPTPNSFVLSSSSWTSPYTYVTSTSENTKQIYTTESGRVGIGTFAPAYKLDITGPATANGSTLRLNDAASLSDSKHLLLTRLTATGWIGVAGSQTNDPLCISRSNGYDLIVDSNGKIGAGISANLSGNVHIKNASAGDQTLLVLEHSAGYGTNTENRIDFYDDEAHKIAARIAQYYSAVAGNRWGLKFYTNSSAAINSTPALTLMGNNNVGVGTTNPNYQLTVIGANQATANVTDAGNKGGSILVASSLNNSNQGGSVLFANVNDAGTYTPQWAIKSLFLNGNGYGLGDLAFSSRRATGDTSLTESVRFTYDGKVGIGTASPGAKLDVNGDVYISPNTAGKNTFILSTNASNDARLLMRSDTTTKVDIQANGTSYFNGGNVGIGTASPTTLLSVGGAGSTGPASGITFGGDAQANLYRSAEDTIRTDGAFIAGGYIRALSYVQLLTNLYPDSYTDNLNLNIGNLSATNWETAIKIKPGSYVGIGTTQPSGKLHIVSSIANETVLRVDGTNGTLLSVVDDLSDSLFSVNNGAGLPVLEVFADDRIVAGQYNSGDFVLVNNKIGIGTTNPANKLSVIGAASIGSNSFNVAAPANGLTVEGKVGIGTSSVDSWAQLKVIGTTALGGITYVTDKIQALTAFPGSATSLLLNPDGGNVGINTTSPAQRLHVRGEQVYLYNDLNTSNTFFYARNSGAGNAGIKMKNIDGEWTIIANDRLRFIDDDAGVERLSILSNGNVGVGLTIPQKPLDAISSSNDFVTVGATSLGVGNWCGIHFGYRENNNFYRKSAIVFERTDLTSSNSQGKVHILNGPQAGSSNATLSDAKITINEAGKVGIGTTEPLNKLSVIASNGTAYYNRTDPVATFQGTSPSTILVSVDGNVDGYYAELKLGNAQSTYYPYSAYVRGIQGAGIDYYRLEFGTSAGSAANTRMTIANNGNVGIGLTNTQHKLQISGGSVAFTSSTGLAVEMLGMTSLNVAYVGPYNTSTDGNAPATVLFNHGASVQQTYFYSSGRIAMVLNKEGRLNIAGNAGNTPPALLNVGPTSSVTAVSGMSFGNDAEANFYRSAEDTIKSDGNLIVVGNVTAANLVSGNGTLNYITKWNGTKSVTNSQIFDDGTYVGINTVSNTTYRLQVNGSFAATTKSFDIVHPTVSGKRLTYASLEGPENGVYYRGQGNNNEINLPHYWSGLVHEDSLTVNLTAVGKRKDGRVRNYSVDQIGHNKVYIYTDSDDNIYNYYYTIFAERKDVSKLVTERYTE